MSAQRSWASSIDVIFQELCSYLLIMFGLARIPLSYAALASSRNLSTPVRMYRQFLERRAKWIVASYRRFGCLIRSTWTPKQKYRPSQNLPNDFFLKSVWSISSIFSFKVDRPQETAWNLSTGNFNFSRLQWTRKFPRRTIKFACEINVKLAENCKSAGNALKRLWPNVIHNVDSTSPDGCFYRPAESFPYCHSRPHPFVQITFHSAKFKSNGMYTGSASWDVHARAGIS